jgi:hypothetical protein
LSQTSKGKQATSLLLGSDSTCVILKRDYLFQDAKVLLKDRNPMHTFWKKRRDGGREEGREKGRKEGRERGRKKGREEGREGGGGIEREREMLNPYA